MRVLVVEPTGARLSLVAGHTELAFERLDSDGGDLIAFRVPPGAREVVVGAAKDTGSGRFTLPIDRPHPFLAEILGRKGKGDVGEVIAFIERAPADLDEATRVRLQSQRARLEVVRGQTARAERLLEETIAAHRRLGHVHEAAEDALALAFFRIQYGARYADARRILEDEALVADAAAVPDNHARLAYQAGLLAISLGDTRRALGFMREADARGKRIGYDTIARNARRSLADLLRHLGRRKEADELFRAETAPSPSSSMLCGRADEPNNRAWAVLDRAPGESAATSSELSRAVGWLEQALSQLDAGCPDPARRANVETNLALAHLLLGEPDQASRALARARVAQPRPHPPLATWWLDIEGQILLATDRPGEAIEAFRRLEAVAAAGISHEARWRGVLGRAQGLERLGRQEEAAAAYARAERLLDDERYWIPATEGRDTFLAQRQESARGLVTTLTKLGRTADALASVRRARTRALASWARAERVSELSGPDRTRWEQALENLTRERSALESETARDWQLSAEALARAQRSRRARLGRLLVALDQALAVVGGSSETRREPAEPRSPAPGEVLLAYFDAGDRWLGFAARGEEVISKDLGPIDPTAAPDELSRALLAPFRPIWEGARVVTFLPYGALRNVDLHALPVEGKPLVQSVPVAYLMDLPGARAGAAQEAVGPALVVADARGDLPAAQAEAEVVARRVRPSLEARLLGGAQATRTAVLAALPDASLFHYAGHGEFTGDGGWDSALPLANGERLGVSEILTMPRVPPLVVLSGCETGRAGQDTPLEGMGLAHAFLVAGSQRVVAAIRPVRDQAARRLVEAFYREAGGGADAVTALQAAQNELQAAAPDSDWAAFRVFTM